MTHHVDINEFEARFDELVERAGAGETIVFTRHGAPILQFHRVGEQEDSDLLLHQWDSGSAAGLSAEP